MPLAEQLGVIATAVTSLTIVIGALVWLVWPRIEARFEQIARSINRVEQATTADDPDTLSRHARVAAGAASEIPEIREQLAGIAAKQDSLDGWQRRTDRRLDSVEETVTLILSAELRARLRESAELDPDDETNGETS